MLPCPGAPLLWSSTVLMLPSCDPPLPIPTQPDPQSLYPLPPQSSPAPALVLLTPNPPSHTPSLGPHWPHILTSGKGREAGDDGAPIRGPEGRDVRYAEEDHGHHAPECCHQAEPLCHSDRACGWVERYLLQSLDPSHPPTQPASQSPPEAPLACLTSH